MPITISGTNGLSGTTTIASPTIIDGYTEEVYTSNTGTAFTVSLTNGSMQNLTLTGNCTFTFPTAAAGQSFIMILRQDATGGRTVTWPATVKWPGSATPTITATATRYDLLAFTGDSTYWLGRVIAQNYA